MPGEPIMCLVNSNDSPNLKATPVVLKVLRDLQLKISRLCLTLPFIHWETLGKLLNLPEPQAPLL